MNPKLRVLVFPCGSEIGLEIRDALCWSKDLELLGGSSVADNHGRFVYRRYFDGLPMVDAPEFPAAIESFVGAQRVDAILPAHDSAVVALARLRDRLSCVVVTSPLATCTVCRSKSRTYSTLAPVVKVPDVFAADGQVPVFPVFMKPDVGQGSRGTSVAYSEPERRHLLWRDRSLITLEYLPGPEFTVDCFTDRHGRLRFAGARERLRIANGISVHTKSVEDPGLRQEIQEWAQRINSALEFRGAWFFQLKSDRDGALTLLEVAPRIAGSMGLYRSVGVNLALLSVYDAFDIDVEVLQAPVGQVELDRAFISRFSLPLTYRHVYVDLDDTLLLGTGQVNPTLVAFLYQCVNDAIGVHLLTRHAGDLAATLERSRLARVFDSVTVVPAERLKSDYVALQPAIYIDDSFRERREVTSRLNVPAFDLDAVPSLLDWRR